MKKLFLVMAAAFAMVACQTDINEVGVVADGVVAVEFEVGTPQLRAYSDGLTVDDLQYAVYEVKGEGENKTLTNLSSLNGAKELDGLHTNVQIELANNKKYAVIFWADDENAPYKFEPTVNTVTVTVGYDNAKCNDESRDAFYAYKEFEVKGAAKIDVVLKRPFAQVNVGTSDIELAKKSGFTPSTSALVVKNACNVLDLVSGEASGGVDVTFKAEAIPTGEEFKVAGYDYLAMSYVLVGKDQASYDVTYTITDGTTSIENTIGAVPMRANYRTNIYGKLLTSTTDIDVEIKPGFDGNEGVETPSTVSPANTAELQAALDSAVNRSTIQLKAGVNYGVVYLRPIAGGPATKNVDWVGNNYRWETYTLFENLTIIGAEGATIDAVVIEGGTYYNTNHSQSATYPIMLSLIELKNFVIDGVTFTGNGGTDPQGYGNAVNLSGQNIKVNGLTLKNCVLNNDADNARLLYKTESTTRVHTYTFDDETYTFTPSLKDITVTGCTFDGGYMGLELREAENVTITNNVFKVADRNILLPVNAGCTYSGAITITGNTSINAKERFVRASGIGDAVVVIKNNRILGYQGADADYIKVTGGNNVTIEDNEYIVSTAEELKAATTSGIATISVKGEIDLADVVLSGYNGTIIGGEGAVLNTTNFTPSADEAYQLRSQNLTFKNLTIKLPTAGNWLQSGFVGTGVIIFENCKFIGQATLNGAAEWTFNDCEFVSTEDGAYASFVYGAKKATFNRCSFSGVDRAAKVYGSGGVLDVEYNNCTFTSSTLDKNGVEIDGSYATTTVGLNNCSQRAMAGLYAAKGNKVTVYVDGEAVAVAGLTTVDGYSKLFVNADKSEYTVFSAEGLIQMHNYWAANAGSNHMWGKTYSISADIDATGHTWNSVYVVVGNNANNGFVIDGKGHTISNLAINGSLFTGTPNGGNAGTTPGVVRNLTFDNATVANAAGGYGTAVIWGNTYGEITFEDVHIVNSSVTGVCDVAAFVGATSIDSGTIDPIKFINCSVEKCTITAIGGDGCDPTGASGYVGRAFAKTSIVFEGTNTIDAATVLNNADGLASGRVYNYTTWANGGFSGTGTSDDFDNWNGIN